MLLELSGDARDRPAGYDGALRMLHWSTALLIGVNVALGLYSSTLARASAWRQVVLGYHKSFGLLLIVITLLRLGRRLYAPVPPAPAQSKPWEIVAARLGHGLLYAVLLAMPLPGVLWAEGGAREVSFFNLFTLPQVISQQPGAPFTQQPYYKLGKFLHENVFQWALYAALALHMAGVFKHQILDGNRRFLSRMWGWPAR